MGGGGQVDGGGRKDQFRKRGADCLLGEGSATTKDKSRSRKGRFGEHDKTMIERPIGGGYEETESVFSHGINTSESGREEEDFLDHFSRWKIVVTGIF